MSEINCKEDLQHINVMKNVMNNGEIVTHILSWTLFNLPSAEVFNIIRKIIHQQIDNVPKAYLAESVAATLNWHASSSTHFYTNSIYNDCVVKNHVKAMMKDLVQKIKDKERDDFDEYEDLRNREDYCPNWGISYLVTKTLYYGEEEVGAYYVE